MAAGEGRVGAAVGAVAERVGRVAGVGGGAERGLWRGLGGRDGLAEGRAGDEGWIGMDRGLVVVRSDGSKSEGVAGRGIGAAGGIDEGQVFVEGGHQTVVLVGGGVAKAAGVVVLLFGDANHADLDADLGRRRMAFHFVDHVIVPTIGQSVLATTI